MKLKLIIPGWPKSSIWNSFMFRFPYLSVSTLAALTSEGWEVAIEDENVQPLEFDDPVELVGLTSLTPTAPRAYEIAEEFKRRGVKVVMGGFHATWCPEEALGHVDAVVIGEAEGVWQKVLKDFETGSLKSIYRGTPKADLSGIPPARRDLLNRKGYLFLNTVQTTRGCPFDCEFCSVTSFYGHTYRQRPIDDVARDIDTLSGGANFLFIVDDNVIGNPAYAKKLFAMLKERDFKWLSQASINLAENTELLKLAQESNCFGMFVGFESLYQEALNSINKRFGRVDKYADAIKKLHDYGIGIQGSFIFGYDWDTEETFDKVLEFCVKTKLESVLFTILTPFPGTKVFDQMSSEGRLTTADWRRYDMAHAVFKPKNMSAERLEENFLRVNREFHSLPSIFGRLPFFSKRIQVFGPQNFGFRRAWKAFQSE